MPPSTSGANSDDSVYPPSTRQGDHLRLQQAAGGLQLYRYLDGLFFEAKLPDDSIKNIYLVAGIVDTLSGAPSQILIGRRSCAPFDYKRRETGIPRAHVLRRWSQYHQYAQQLV